ncbi:thioesterase II family protein [Streptomyces sp. cmx-4-9]|uniref:thioesterase II family protein n=1 Tax=Streptomyces sp. cmx-4-9 TaxID=2790941 RepID=UPI0039801096
MTPEPVALAADRAGARWFRRASRSTAPRLRLVCLPHAGGTASFFHSWAGAFGSEVEVLSARYPGRQDRIAEPCLDSMDELADALVEALPPLLDRPLALFGHSMGASLAYEVALRLEARHGVRLQGLHVSSRAAPHRAAPSGVHLLDDEAVVRYVRALGGSEAAVLDDPDLRELVLPAIRSDFRIVGTYRAASPIPVQCPVFGYVGDRDPGVGVSDMKAWSEVAPEGFVLRVLSGDHFYLVPRQDELVGELTSRMASS